jgi:fucose permease
MPFRDLVTFEAVTLTIPVTVLFVALLGLANALIWPSMWPLALNGVGRFTKDSFSTACDGRGRRCNNSSRIR